jgi:hypothetical protein
MAQEKSTMSKQDKALHAYLARIGKRGGKNAAASMTKKQRRERATAAGRASGRARRQKGGKS